MKTFKHLKFKKHTYGLINASYEFPNGFSISVSAGSLPYCNPRKDLDSEKDYSTFEVALLDPDGDFVTGELLQSVDDICGWCSREDINNMMELIADQ
jgi:hypothetical protein